MLKSTTLSAIWSLSGGMLAMSDWFLEGKPVKSLTQDMRLTNQRKKAF